MNQELNKVIIRNKAHAILEQYEIQTNEDFTKTVGTNTVPYDKAIDSMVIFVQPYNNHITYLENLLIYNNIPYDKIV